MADRINKSTLNWNEIHGWDQHHDHEEIDRALIQNAEGRPGDTLVIRPNTGISGEILAAGFLLMAGCGETREIDRLLMDLGLGELAGQVILEPRMRDQVRGLGLRVDCSAEPPARTLLEAREFFEASQLGSRAKELALSACGLLAGAFGGDPSFLRPEELCFRDADALLDFIAVGLTAALWDRLNPALIVCGPLPLCDGPVACVGGVPPTLNPAVLALLPGVPIFGLNSVGETVTPVSLALLKAMKTEFGCWPSIIIEKQALVYGSVIFPDVPNGTVFLLGQSQKTILSDPIASLSQLR